MSLPFVSVLMPVRNEANYIHRSLQSVLNQNYPTESFEVIVADGNSEDKTRRIVESFGEKYSNLKMIDNPEKIVSTGLNRAMRGARGEIIIRIDGHCEIDPDYIQRCVSHIENGYDAVGGTIESTGETGIQRIIATSMSSVFGVGNSSFRTTRDKTTQTDTIPFPAYKRSLLEMAGPYDEELVRNQDDEFNFRLRKMGAKLLLAGDLRCRYYIRNSFAGLWRQFFFYGFWKVRVLQKHPRQMSWRQFIPPAFILGLLLLGALSSFSFLARFLLLGILMLYLAATLAASLACADRLPWKLIPGMPVAFWTLHFSYGCGFLYGLYNFRKQWWTES
jgi:glycosyltransferase involved in cell wall biosynthesis